MSAEWTAADCGKAGTHPPHQLMNYTGADDTYDIWCLGVQRNGGTEWQCDYCGWCDHPTNLHRGYL